VRICRNSRGGQSRNSSCRPSTTPPAGSSGLGQSGIRCNCTSVGSVWGGSYVEFEVGPVGVAAEVGIDPTFSDLFLRDFDVSAQVDECE
jgi:hypothetical protein